MYLDASMEDMQYSDTPVAVSLAEQLADIYQEMFNFASTVREASPETLAEVLADFKWRFDSYRAPPYAARPARHKHHISERTLNHDTAMNHITDLCAFLDASPVNFWAVETVRQRL